MNKKSLSKLAAILCLTTLITSTSASLSPALAMFKSSVNTKHSIFDTIQTNNNQSNSNNSQPNNGNDNDNSNKNQPIVIQSDLFTEVKNNNLENVKKFINSSNVNARDYYGNTPLMYAKSKEVAGTILEFAEKLSQHPKYFSKPSNRGESKLYKVLRARDFDGKTPLMKQIENNNKEVIDLLISYATRPDPHCHERFPLSDTILSAYDNNRKSVLMYLAATNNSDLITLNLTGHPSNRPYFLEKISKDFCDHHFEFDNNEYSPLMYAVANNHLEATKILVEMGADVNAIRHDTPPGKKVPTPLSLAIQNNNLEIINYLIEHGAKINDAVKINLELDGNQKAIDLNSWNLLKSAADAKNFDLIELMLKNDTSKEKFTNEFIGKIKNHDEQALGALNAISKIATSPAGTSIKKI